MTLIRLLLSGLCTKWDLPSDYALNHLLGDHETKLNCAAPLGTFPALPIALPRPPQTAAQTSESTRHPLAIKSHQRAHPKADRPDLKSIAQPQRH
jgi:hypothetical protein